MKTTKYLLSGLLAAAMIVPVSCSKNFLKEELTTKQNTDYLNTNEGVESLNVALYSYLRYYHCSEAGYSYFNYGTDEYTVGADNSNGMWNDYGSSLSANVTAVNSNTVGAGSLWDYMYTGINIANTLIDRIEGENKVYTGGNANKIAGFAHFMRGFHYFNLVSQYGDVPIKTDPTDPSSPVSFEFERSSRKDVFDQIEKDLLKAYELLPDTPGKTGEATKAVAAHFLAKTYLWRASEQNDDWNSSTKSADLDKVITYATEVINKHPLAENFVDLWDYTGPNSANESNPEVVFAAQFTGPSTATWNVGGCLYFYTTSQYRDLTGMFRDVSGGREYNRLRTTYYSIYQYDLVNDSRVWKTFRTKLFMNAVDNAKKAGYEAGKNLGLLYIFNQPGDSRFSEKVRYNDGNANNLTDIETGLKVGNAFVFFPKGASRWDTPMELTANNDGFKYFPMNTKYVDGSRESIADSHCFRDGIIARSAEDYFFIAEAYIRKGEYAKATEYLQVIRDRAAWKADEDREEHRDGGQSWKGSIGAQAPGITSYCPRSSYYESNNIELGSLDSEASSLKLAGPINVKANLPAPDQEIADKLGVTGDKDVALCFLLNEKSREMSCELVRWVDLARTKTLESRIKAFNREAAVNFNASKHYLRPIPQAYLNVLQRDGKALTDAEKHEIQNPGY